MGADREADVTRLADMLDEMARTYPGQPIPTFTRQHHERIAAALMPVVDAIARQRAADELEAAADWLWDETGAGTYAHNHLKDRAAALRAPHA